MYQHRVGRSVLSGISGGIFLIGLAIAFWLSSFNGDLFLPILFATLAVTSVFGSISSLNPKAVYGSLYGFVWLLGLGILFLPGVGFWPWILVLCGASAIIGAFSRPIIGSLGGCGIRVMNSQQQQNANTYQQPEYPTYQEGYRPTTETYQEGNEQYQYPSAQPQPKYDSPQYEEPMTQYPQELPPMQQ